MVKEEEQEVKPACKCFTPQKIEQLMRQPIIETIVVLSEDKRGSFIKRL